MSDKEIIIQSLKKVERRIRGNRLFKDLTVKLSLFLLFPIAFKIVDLIWPFRGRTVTTVLLTWTLAVAVYFIWRSRQKGTLAQTAAEVDIKAALADELKTAYWFINNPRASDWVDVQIRRAARKVSELNIDRLYPRSIPSASYLAAGLLVLLVAMNFAPLPWNNNWLLLQAAPAFSLTDAEQQILRQAEQALGNTELAERMQEIMQNLQDGTIDGAQALEQLDELQKELAKIDPDAAAIEAALNEVAEALAGSEALSEVAQALRDRDLVDAAELLKDVSENATAEEMKGMQQSLDRAAENAQQSLEELGSDLKDAADAIAKQDEPAAKQALAQAAESLQDLAEKLQNQEMSKEAAQQLKQFEQSLQERLEPEQQQQTPAGEPEEGTAAEGGEPQPGGGMPDAEEGSAGQQTGEPQEGSEGGSQDNGLNPSGTPGETKNQPSTPLELEVQLQQEGLSGLYDEAIEPEKIEETSKQERSRLDYRNVESQLSPAQKDLLNQERIPWEYRNLIKNYFEAIRPPQEK